ncbi:MAG: ribosome biogenesis GTPase YlqF [Bacilli bacterium]|nr:ribosome biogenesis GTPase YlqF [Bacilli bacterium]
MDVIHWYPGHMKKASNKLLEAIKLVDLVIELVDARSPNKTTNPFFKTIGINKPHLLVLMKSDLADTSKIELDSNSILVNINDQKSLNALVNKITSIMSKKREKEIKRGIKPLPIKAMIIGIPNVGKSSLINALVKKKITKVENKPGLTKNNRWINVNNKFYLLDTPGILPTDYLESNYVLALIGAIKINILPVIELSEFAYSYITKHYPKLYVARYGEIKKNSHESFKAIAEKYQIKNDKSVNFERARSLFLKDIRDGKLGKLYFD